MTRSSNSSKVYYGVGEFMKKNKGFTLIELIAVITILAVVALITVPAVNKAITKSKERAYETQKSEIIAAAKKWNLENVGSDLGKKQVAYDVLFILDTSGSMQEGTKAEITTGALNDIIKILMDSNEKNRFTITRAGFGSSVLLPLDHYYIKNTSGKIFNYGSSSFTISSDVYDSNNKLVVWNSYVSYGEEHEYFQLALKLGVEQLVTNKASDGLKRKPVVVILSDGFPTIYHTDYQNPGVTGYVNSNSLSTVQISGAYYTILTYNYYRDYLTSIFNMDVPFYTIGLNMENGNIDEDEFAKMFLNPTSENVNSTNSIGAYTTGLYNLLTSSSNPYLSNYNYATKSYIGSNMSQEDILGIFKDALADAITDTGKVQIQTLVKDGYIDESALTDPRTGKKMAGYIDITYDETKDKYLYEFKE